MTPADRPLPAHAQTIADLRAARALIEKGWTRGTSERGGRVCLVAALSRAAGHDGYAYKPVRDAVSETVNDEYLADWNDAQPSKRPVLAAIDATIARLEASA